MVGSMHLRWAAIGVLGVLPLACSVGEAGDGPTSFGSLTGPTSASASGETSSTSGGTGDEGGTTGSPTTTPDPTSSGPTSSDPDTGSEDDDTASPEDTGTPAMCGNGTAEGDEACDGNDLRGETCESQGYAGGILGCRPDCTDFHYAACQAPESCGDGVKNGTEQCDGADLGGQTCQTLGWDMGVLSCSANCAFNTSGCQNAPCAPIFGDCSQIPCCEGLFCFPINGNTCGPTP